MQLVRHDLTTNNDIIKLYAFGDLHIASQAFDKKAFLKLVKEIKESNGYWIGMGDFGECIPVSDRRFDPDSIRETYRDQLPRYHQLEVLELKDMLEPIRDKCLGVLEGNHEVNLRSSQFDMMWELCNYFRWHNLTADAFIKLNITNPIRQKDLDLDFFVAHGYGAARTKGGNVAKLQRVMDAFLADVILVGHSHVSQPIIDNKLRLKKRTKEPKLESKIRLGFIVPSFYRTYYQGIDTYASRALYSPSVIGAWRATIKWQYTRKGDKLIVESPITNAELLV